MTLKLNAMWIKGIPDLDEKIRIFRPQEILLTQENFQLLWNCFTEAQQRFSNSDYSGPYIKYKGVVVKPHPPFNKLEGTLYCTKEDGLYLSKEQ